MRCALCLQKAHLRNSHIIPEFLYESLYDDKHRLQILSLLPERDNWKEQKGLREKLLCDICEQNLSVYEGYARRLLVGGAPVTYRTENAVVFLSDLDYVKFRLFQLSVLWRAGVSTLPFFARVTLGSHQEVLRQLILHADPGSSRRYCCLMFGIKFDKEAFTGVITQPSRVRLSGSIAYRFLFGGFMWAFIVTNQDVAAELLPCTLQPPGTAAFIVKDATEMHNLATFAKDLERMGRAPR